MKNALGFVPCLIGLVHPDFESISQTIRHSSLLYVGMKVTSIIVKYIHSSPIRWMCKDVSWACTCGSGGWGGCLFLIGMENVRKR